MQHHNAICLSIDRLGASALGAYGNTTFSTPQFDRLAAESFVFDQMIIDRTDTAGLFDGYLRGRGAFDGGAPSDDSAPSDGVLSLPERLSRSGVHTVLITDDPSINWSDAFDECIRLSDKPSCRAADEVGQTELFHLFAVASDTLRQTQLRQSQQPFLLWIHCQGMAGSWDAPREFRRGFAEEDDPRPPDFVVPPNRRVAADEDPDDLLGIRFAYAGQVVLLDMALGALLDVIDDGPLGQQTLLMLAGVRGFPLGEHGRIGSCDGPLHEELVHAPLMIRMPGGEGATCRELGLVQPTDLFATLSDWWDLDSAKPSLFTQSLLPIVRGEAISKRDRACVLGQGAERAIRTAAWYLRQHEQGMGLYCKPDDRWEVNDILSRCQDVGEKLSAVLDEFAATAEGDDVSRLTPLDSVLAEGL